MYKVSRTRVPKNTLLKTYEAMEGSEADCFQVDVEGRPDIQRFIRIFFDTWVFRLERRVLSLMGVDYATTDDVIALAKGRQSSLAAWTTLERNANEIILAFDKPTGRTWLQVSTSDEGAETTRLSFGSALLPKRHSSKSKPAIGKLLKASLPIHRLYARILLAAAAADWKRNVGISETD